MHKSTRIENLMCEAVSSMTINEDPFKSKLEDPTAYDLYVYRMRITKLRNGRSSNI
jgi:hypothetical protein